MKTYRIVITSKAEAALTSFVDHIAIDEAMPKTAERWLQKALLAVGSLSQLPDRCSVAPEDSSFEFTVRMRLVDNCMFLYRVDEATSTVVVFGFRHGRQEPLTGE